MAAGSGAVVAANRFGLGARPGELDGIGSDPRGWLRSQLLGGAPLLVNPDLQNTAQILTGAVAIVGEQRGMRVAQYLRPLYRADVQARLECALTTGRPFVERLVHFWSNHFAVSVDKLPLLGIAGSFEREAIRPHVLGGFSDLLLAVEQHPAMLLYLDNQRSVGPDSPLAQRAGRHGRRVGLNENLGRETLELHTLGVDAGYTQADVTSFAAVLTGWSVGGGKNGPANNGQPGTFMFREALHEPGAQRVFGRRYAQAGQAQGIAVLEDLAADPATARHIATQLARHFIADEPPPAAIDRLEKAWRRSGGDLTAVYSALVDTPQAWESVLCKFKTPADYVHSLGRALDLPPPMHPRLLAALDLLGQRPFAPGSPAGWPDRSSDWDGASELMKRIQLADVVAQRLGDQRDAMALAPQLLGVALTQPTREAIAGAASPAQALTLLLAAPEFLRR